MVAGRLAGFKKKMPSTKMSRSCMLLWGTKHTWRMRSRPGSGPLGTPFHHLSKQAWRARITKTTFTLPPYQHVPLGFFFFEDYMFLCDSFLGKSSASIDITQGSFSVEDLSLLLASFIVHPIIAH